MDGVKGPRGKARIPPKQSKRKKVLSAETEVNGYNQNHIGGEKASS